MEKSATAPAVVESKVPKPVEEKVIVKPRSKLAQEEAAIESKIIQSVLDGNWEVLRPNSGTSVDIRGSHLCIDYREEVGYRVWEWHGHCMVYEEGECYTPQYIYGNYFEPLIEEEEVTRPVGLGLLANNRRIMPGFGGVLGPIGRQGVLPRRNLLDEYYRCLSK